MNSLTDKLVEFVQILRQLGVRISIAETLDAVESLKMINPLEKSQFKAALKTTLIKNARDTAAFDRAFQLFFVTQEEKEHLQANWDAKLEAKQNETLQAESELAFQGKQLDIPQQLIDVYKMIPEHEKKRLQDFLSKTSSGHKVDQAFQPIVENILKSSLAFWHRQLPSEDLVQLEKAKRQLLGKTELDSVIDSAQAEAGESGSGQNPLFVKNMQDIAEHEIPQVTALIKRLAHKLSVRISRRFRLSAKKGVIDIRRSIRRNMRYGGTMITIKYKSRKIKKPSIVILCDVSASMTKYVRFTLPLLYGLSSAVKNIESFIFANELEQVTNYFRQKADFLNTIEDILGNSSQVAQGTNIFAALSGLREDHARLLSRSTTLFIVSDARTISPQEAVREMRIVREKVKQIVWLNTQPKEMWEQNAAIGEFSKYAAMFECCTLAHLAKILTLNL